MSSSIQEYKLKKSWSLVSIFHSKLLNSFLDWILSIYPHPQSSPVILGLEFYCLLLNKNGLSFCPRKKNESSKDLLFTCRRFCISFSLYIPSLSSVQAFLGLSGMLGFVVTPLETVENFKRYLHLFVYFLFPFNTLKWPQSSILMQHEMKTTQQQEADQMARGMVSIISSSSWTLTIRNQENWQIQDTNLDHADVVS